MKVTNAAPSQFTHQYVDPGEYAINITAYNLHSDEEYGYNKFTHNMTRVVNIQNPVEFWNLNLGDPAKWLDSEARKKCDVYYN